MKLSIPMQAAVFVGTLLTMNFCYAQTVNVYLDFGEGFTFQADPLFVDDYNPTRTFQPGPGHYFPIHDIFEYGQRTVVFENTEDPNGRDIYAPNPSRSYDSYEYLNSALDVIQKYQFDYDLNGTVNQQDLSALKHDMVHLLKRAYAAFDVNVTIVRSSTWQDVMRILANNTNDTYIFVGGNRATVTILGRAPRDSGKLHDDIGYIFFEQLVQRIQSFNNPTKMTLAFRAAKSIVHEVGHTFGVDHINPLIYGAQDIMTSGLSYSVPDYLTIPLRGWEYPFVNAPSVTQSSYEVIREALGPKYPGLEYVSGTKYNDRIVLSGTPQAVTVSVEAYADDAYTDLRTSTSYTLANPSHVIIEAGQGNDYVDVQVNVGVTLHGDDGGDWLQSNGGDDILMGEAGDDYLLGGTGHDIYQFGYGRADQGSDVVHDNAYHFEANGHATLDFSDFRTGIDINTSHLSLLEANVYQTVSNNSEGILRISLKPAGVSTTAQTSGIEEIIGSEFDDTIRGNPMPNRIEGRGGNDKLYGENGSDILIGGMGNDYLYGGSDADELYGDCGSDYLSGSSGDDFLFSGADTSRDRLRGGTGQDTFLIVDNNDTIYDLERGDTVQTYRLPRFATCR